MKHTSITIDEDLHRKLKVFCAENDIKMSVFASQAIASELAYFTHMDDYEKELAGDGIREMWEEMKQGYGREENT